MRVARFVDADTERHVFVNPELVTHFTAATDEITSIHFGQARIQVQGDATFVRRRLLDPTD